MTWRGVALVAAALQVLAVGPAFAADASIETYVVRRGDTLYGLAQRYFLRIDDYRIVQKLNGVADPRRLRVGARLKTPVRLLRTQVVEAQVAGFKGDVAVVTAKGLRLPVARGARLPEGALISTGANAYLRLDLPDGSHLSIPSQSRVRLVKMRAVEMTGVVRRELQVLGGRLESQVTPLRDPRDSYTVRTPMSVSAVRGTEFAVSYDERAARAATEVVSGAVTVTGAEDKRQVAAHEGAISSASGTVGPLELLPAPALVDPGRIQDDDVVRFSIATPRSELGYRIRLATDAGFVDVLEETTSATGDLVFGPLEDGVYFLRLAAIDGRGLLGLPATYAFQRRRNTLAILAPIVTREGGRRHYRFRWQAGGEGERSYRLQLFAEGKDVPVVDEAGLSGEELTITDLPPGVYNWRVMSRTFTRGGLVEKWSSVERFEIGH